MLSGFGIFGVACDGAALRLAHNFHNNVMIHPACACLSLAVVGQATVKHQLSAEEAKAQAAELVRKARIKREREEAELARLREREVRQEQTVCSFGPADGQFTSSHLCSRTAGAWFYQQRTKRLAVVAPHMTHTQQCVYYRLLHPLHVDVLAR